MSAFVMAELGFVQLAAELAFRAEYDNNILHYSVCEYLRIDPQDFTPDAHPQASVKCQQLMDANMCAVNQSYGQHEQPTQLSFVKVAPQWSDLQFFKHLTCLRYQMNEGDVPEGETFKALDRLCGQVAQNILREQADYDALAWGWPDTTGEPEYIPTPNTSGVLTRLGQVVATRAAVDVIADAGQDPIEFITMHQHLEQGELGEDDWQSNLSAVANDDDRVLSKFKTSKGEFLYVITECDRSATTILLPSEY
jgi:hypothetical protein